MEDCLSCQIVEDNITKLDDVLQNEDKKITSECNFLFKWYHQNSTIID